jgi:hypothetical protein
MNKLEDLMYGIDELMEEFRTAYKKQLERISKMDLSKENREDLGRYLLISLLEILITESNGEIIEHIGEFTKFALSNAILNLFDASDLEMYDETKKAYA